MTDNKLQNYIDNKSQFEDDAVLAAVWEFEKRNKAGDDIKNIELQIEKKRIDENERLDKIKKKSNVTDDPNAPILYHLKFVLFFGAFFSVFAGSILMALNFTRLERKKEAWLVVLSGLIYSTVQMLVLSQVEIYTAGLTMAISLLGMYLLETVFWKKQVPADLKFRKRNVWGAIIIGFTSLIPLIYAIIITE